MSREMADGPCGSGDKGTVNRWAWLKQNGYLETVTNEARTSQGLSRMGQLFRFEWRGFREPQDVLQPACGRKGMLEPKRHVLEGLGGEPGTRSSLQPTGVAGLETTGTL